MDENRGKRRRPISEEERRQRIRRMRIRKRRRKQRRILIAIMCVVLGVASYFGYAMLYDTVYKTCVVEAGYTIEASDLEKRGIGEIAFTENSSIIDTTKVGVYKVQVKKGLFTHTCEITVRDTVAPVATGIEMTIGALTEVNPEDCVTNVSDITSLSYEFVNVIDRELYEPQNIAISIEDEGGNVTEIISVITVSDDLEAPIIEAPDVIESALGEGIAYLQSISATDNSGNDVELEIDNSSVDIDTEGEYVITCTATDWVGNVSTQEVTISIYKKSTEQETVEAYADEVLAEITDASMSEYDICYAIFQWCRNNIAYSGHSEKGDWVAGAYDGFFYGSGDCYTYFATAKVLLTQAGITNMDIEKIPSSTTHYWNLVDIGDGWLHFDTTRRADGTQIFLWTDEELMTYSNANNLSHNYDTSLYPDIT